MAINKIDKAMITRRTMLKANSILAKRFPQLYAQQLRELVGETTSPCPGSSSDQRELLR